MPTPSAIVPSPEQAPSKARAWALLAPAMVLPLLAAFIYFDWLSEHPAAKLIYTGTKIFTLVWPLIVVVWIGRERFPWPRFSQSHHWRSLPMGLVTGGLIVGIMFGLMQTPLREVIVGSAESIRVKTRDLGVLDHYWTFGLFIALIHSLLEEYYWRWFVYGQLARLVPSWLAHGLAGIAFAAHHVVISTQYFPLMWGLILGSLVGVGGVIWSVMLSRQRTLAGAWFSHMLVDFGLLAIGHWLLFGTYF